MNVATHHQLAGFIWRICNLLQGPYKPKEYGDVILPLTVLRRFDCVLCGHQTGRARCRHEVQATRRNRSLPTLEDDVTPTRYCEAMTDESPVQAKAPVKAFRKGMTLVETLVELIRKFFSVRVGTVMQDSKLGYYVSSERLDWYVAKFAGRHNRRRMEPADMMASSVQGIVGKTLPYAELVAS